jgi:hypothetical protein
MWQYFIYLNNLQLFYFFFFVSTDIKKAIKAMLPYVIWGKTDIKSLLGNPENNKEKNSKPVITIIQN